MMQLLFRSRWFALAWAVALCFTISRFFGEGGGQEKLAQTAADIRAQRFASAQAPQPEAQQFVDESVEISGEEQPY